MLQIAQTFSIAKSVSAALLLNEADLSRLIEMAWEDHTPFEAIEQLYGIPESQVIVLMRQNMKPNSFRMWRKRVTGRASKHVARRTTDQARHYAAAQYKIHHGRK